MATIIPRCITVAAIKAVPQSLTLVLMHLFCMPQAMADTTRADCGFSMTAATPPVTTAVCTFSQRQGFISISIDGGPEFDLRPVGKAPGNFRDAEGRAVFRRSGLGQQGQLFQLPDRFLYVYWARFESTREGSAREELIAASATSEQWACSGGQLVSATGCQLDYGGIIYSLQASANGSLNTLTVQASGLERPDELHRHEIDGNAYRAEVADLDANGWPEVYVYVSSAGSGSYGSLVAYAVNRGKSSTPVYMRPLSSVPEAQAGYMGHDEFAVVENRLVRRFPVYNEGDTNSAPTGGMRQLQYKLIAGEAGWTLEVDRVVEY